MSGYFAKLPPELMQEILSYMDLLAPIPLMECSKALHAYLEPELFRHKVARDLAMHWAIQEGRMDTVCRLVEQHNASPSFYGGTGIDNAGGRYIVIRDGKVMCEHPQSTLLAVIKRAPNIEEALATFVRLGASLHPQMDKSRPEMQAKMTVTLEQGWLIEYQQMRRTIQRIASMPAKTGQQQRDKLALVQFFYEQGYRTTPDSLGRPCIFVESLATLIRRDEDLPIVQYVLEQETKIEAAQQQARGTLAADNAMPAKPAKLPLVDRPARCGPHGAYISPLSAAVLTNSVRIFEFLLEQGATIHGPALDFAKYGPSKHALHIPIFAVAYTLAHRKTNETGDNWMQLVINRGADINQMALCRMSGTHKPYRSVEESFSYYSQGQRYPPLYYFWATPLDVFVDCVSKKYIRRKSSDVGSGLPGTSGYYERCAVQNIAAFQDNGAKADLGSLREPPRPRGYVPNPSDPELYSGPPTPASLDRWRNLKRVVSPSTLEILLDRITVAGLAFPVGCSYAELLVEVLQSGEGQAAWLLSKYDGPAPETRLSMWPWGPETAGRRTLALLIGNVVSHDELHRYIVYAQRRACMLFMNNVLQNLEMMFNVSQFQVDGPYLRNHRADDIEMRQLTVEGASEGKKALIGPSPGTKHNLPSWTGLHELCWLWNMEMWHHDQKVREQEADPLHSNPLLEPRFALYVPGTTKFLNELLSYGFDVLLDAGDGRTPIDVLTDDHDGTMRPGSMSFLNDLANFMRATWSVLKNERKKNLQRRRSSMRSSE